MLWIHGISGKLGQSVVKENTQFKLGPGSSSRTIPAELAAGLESCSDIIDCSNASGNLRLLEASKNCSRRGQTILIASTGISRTTYAAWEELSQQKSLRLMFAPNTSLGIRLLSQASLAIIDQLQGYDIIIEETHHRDKVDSPSGTAVALAAQIESKDREVSINSSRGGGVFGEHRIRFIGKHEELCFQHRAFSRSLFAQGALRLLQDLRGRDPGIYTP